MYENALIAANHLRFVSGNAALQETLHFQNAGAVQHDGVNAVAPGMHHIHEASDYMASFFLPMYADVHKGDPHTAAQNAFDLQQLLAAT